GRLKAFSNVWLKVTKDPVIRQWIQGYKIPFMSRPTQMSCPVERTWSDKEKLLLDKQINKLIDKGAIVRCFPSQGQFLSNIFLVPKPDGTHRLILNLKKLSEFVAAEHFKIEDWKVAKRLIGPHDYMATLDLKDAYYLVPIKKMDRKFLRFSY
ncbi:Transposon Ty3-G Gag-Pol polyprotein, partial [Camponotus floridanus]